MKIKNQDQRFFSKVDYLKDQNMDLGEKIRPEREFIINKVMTAHIMRDANMRWFIEK